MEDGTIERRLKRDLKGFRDDMEIFVPCATFSKGDQRVTVHLMQGYVFVQSGLPEFRYFALETKPYVKQVMSMDGDHYGALRTLSVLADHEIDGLRRKLHEHLVQDLSVGSWVRIVEGRFKNLCGRVRYLLGDEAIVHLGLRSMEVIASIPRAFLDPEDDPFEEAQPGSEKLCKPLPPPTDFVDPLVSVLGRMVNYDVNQYVNHRLVRDHVLTELGVQIRTPPYGWKIKGRKSLYRQVFYAFRNQRPKYTTEALTCQGPKRGQWGLTSYGVERALYLNKPIRPDQFEPHLVLQMGRISQFKSYYPVDQEETIQQTLESSGISASRPQRGWSREGDFGLDKKICKAFATLSEKGLTREEANAWELTPQGALMARKLRKEVPDKLIPRLI